MEMEVGFGAGCVRMPRPRGLLWVWRRPLITSRFRRRMWGMGRRSSNAPLPSGVQPTGRGCWKPSRLEAIWQSMLIMSTNCSFFSYCALLGVEKIARSGSRILCLFACVFWILNFECILIFFGGGWEWEGWGDRHGGFGPFPLSAISEAFGGRKLPGSLGRHIRIAGLQVFQPFYGPAAKTNYFFFFFFFFFFFSIFFL